MPRSALQRCAAVAAVALTVLLVGVGVGDIVGTAEGKNVNGLRTPNGVDANSGTFTRTIRLLHLPGPFPLTVAIAHRSDNTPLPHPLGSASKWQHSILPQLDMPLSTLVRVSGINPGQLIVFQKQGQDWDQIDSLGNSSTVPYVMKETADWFHVQDPLRGIVYTFDKNANNRIGAATDRNGNSWKYTYGATGDVPTKIEDGCGRSLTITADDPFKPGQFLIKTITGQAGRQVGFEYSSQGSLVFLDCVTDAEGKKTSFDYDMRFSVQGVTKETRAEGNSPIEVTYDFEVLNKVSDPRVKSISGLSGTDTLTFNPDKNEVTLTRNDGTSVTVEHFGNDGPPKSFTDETGKTIVYTKDDKERLASMTDRRGHTSSVGYDATSGKMASFTDPLDNVTEFVYADTTQQFTNPCDPNDTVSFTFRDVKEIKFADGTSRTCMRDGKGNLTELIDEDGCKFTFTYDGKGNRVTAENPLGGILTNTFDSGGNLWSVTDSDPSIGTTMFTLDGANFVKGVHHADGSTSTAERNDWGQIVCATDEEGNKLITQYDDNGNPIIVLGPENQKLLTTYDSQDRPASVTTGEGNQTTVTRDDRGRILGVVNPAGVRFDARFDPRGPQAAIEIAGRVWSRTLDDDLFVSSIGNSAGETVQVGRNAVGLITGLTNGEGETTQFVRDVRNRIIQIIRDGVILDIHRDGRGNVTGFTSTDIGSAAFELDGLSNATKVVAPNGDSVTRTFTANGRHATTTDGLGATWTRTYDARGRLVRVDLPDGSHVLFKYDKVGRLIGREHSDGAAVNFTLDRLGRPVATEGVNLKYDLDDDVIETRMHGRTNTATFVKGQLADITHDDGMTVNYGYDPDTGMNDRVSNTLSQTVIDIGYDAALRMNEIRRDNGIDTKIERDRAGRIKRIQHGSLSLEYIRNDDGRVVKEVRLGLVPTVADLLRPATVDVGYDASGTPSGQGNEGDARQRMMQLQGTGVGLDGFSRITSVGGEGFDYTGFGHFARYTDAGSGKLIDFDYSYALDGAGLISAKSAEDDIRVVSRLRGRQASPLYLVNVEAGGSHQVQHLHYDLEGRPIATSDEDGNISPVTGWTPKSGVVGGADGALAGMHLHQSGAVQFQAGGLDILTDATITNRSTWDDDPLFWDIATGVQIAPPAGRTRLEEAARGAFRPLLGPETRMGRIQKLFDGYVAAGNAYPGSADFRTYGADGFGFDDTTFTATWTFDAFEADKLLLDITGSDDPSGASADNSFSFQAGGFDLLGASGGDDDDDGGEDDDKVPSGWFGPDGKPLMSRPLPDFVYPPVETRTPEELWRMGNFVRALFGLPPLARTLESYGWGFGNYDHPDLIKFDEDGNILEGRNPRPRTPDLEDLLEDFNG